MNRDLHLSKLKVLKIERNNGALFSSPDECMDWIDSVLPLLRYNKDHYDNFSGHADYVRITTLSSDTLMAHLNPMIGIVKQAIYELESNIETTSNSKSDINNNTDATDNWYQRPMGIIGIAVFSGILIVLAIYVIKQFTGLNL